jgi:hypothetical protein
MADTIDLLHFATLTEVVNHVLSPNTFLKKLLFSNHRSMPTENFEIGVRVGERDMAPLVKKNGQAVMVSGYNTKFINVSPANIRLKRAVSPEVLFRRMPGMDIFQQDAAQIQKAAEQAFQDDMQRIGDMISNAEEYLCAQALTGVINYQSVDMESFQVDFGRANGNTIADDGLFGGKAWDESGSDPLQDIKMVKRLFSQAGEPAPTDAIMGEGASNALQANAAVKTVLAFSQTNILAGQISFLEQFRDDGALYLGTLGGVRMWEYSRQVNDPTGQPVDLVGSTKCHFVSNSPAAEMVLYYGAIPDLDALQGGAWVGERFAKSWMEPDPSQRLYLATSRPLPVLRRPNATATLTVVES